MPGYSGDDDTGVEAQALNGKRKGERKAGPFCRDVRLVIRGAGGKSNNFWFCFGMVIIIDALWFEMIYRSKYSILCSK